MRPWFPTLMLPMVFVTAVTAQQVPPAPPAPAADSADVKTLDGIMHAIYDVISGDKAKARDWEVE